MMQMMPHTFFLCLLLACVLIISRPVCSIPGLSEQQEKWLESVTYGNLSTNTDQKWPSLSVNQTKDLAFNVLQYKAMTVQANYPYHQAVEVWYKDKNRTQAVLYDDVGDGAAWTGLHLASLVHEYLSTKNDTVMADLWQTLEAIDLLTTCTGKTGYIARFAAPATDPPFFAYYSGYHSHYSCVSPHEDYVWLGDSSRDMYHGISFGLTNAWVWLQSNATIANKVKTLIERIVDTLRKDDFWIVSPKNEIVNPVPMHSATWRKLAMSVNYNKYKDMEDAYVFDFWAEYLTGMKLKSKSGSAYFANELMVEGMYVLSLLEKEDKRREALLERFTEIVVNNSDHYQPGFSAFYLSAFPNTSDHNIPQGVLQGGLSDYPVAPNWDHMVDQSSNPKYMPHVDSDHSKYALMIRDRPPTTYLWQRTPTQLKGGTAACCFQRKHLDLILPYWMGRTSGFILTAK